MGNFWSEQSESLINVKSHFLNPPTVETFKEIEDRLTWYEKYKLGYLYKVWRTACLHHFMMTKRTDLCSEKLVCNFLDIEHDIITGFEKGEEWSIYPMLVLWKVTEKNRYKKRINQVDDRVFKKKIEEILSDMV